MDTFFWYWEFSALCDLDGDSRAVAGLLGDVFDLFDDIVALEDFAEDDVLAIEMAVQELALVPYGIEGWLTLGWR